MVGADQAEGMDKTLAAVAHLACASCTTVLVAKDETDSCCSQIVVVDDNTAVVVAEEVATDCTVAVAVATWYVERPEAVVGSAWMEEANVDNYCRVDSCCTYYCCWCLASCLWVASMVTCEHCSSHLNSHSVSLWLRHAVVAAPAKKEIAAAVDDDNYDYQMTLVKGEYAGGGGGAAVDHVRTHQSVRTVVYLNSNDALEDASLWCWDAQLCRHASSVVDHLWKLECPLAWR